MVYEKLEATRLRVKYKHFFHMRHLYIMMHEWLLEHSWAPQYDKDFNETLYLQRENQQRGGELWIWWRCSKNPGDSTYYRYNLNIDIHILLLKESEIVHKGQKYQTNWGEVEIDIKADLITDPEKKFEKSIIGPLNNFLRGRILKEQVQNHKIELYREAYRLQEALKAYFNLSTYLPEPEDQAGLYFPAGGIGEA